MYFDLISEISGIETFATSRGIRELSRLKNSMALVGGEKEKGLPIFASVMGLSIMLSYTGMKPPELAVRN